MAAAFLRTLARALKVARLYSRDHPVVDQGRKGLRAQLNDGLVRHGPWRFRITPDAIWLGDEPVVRPLEIGPSLETPRAPEEKLPFLLHRDGIRALTLEYEVSAAEFDALFEAFEAVSVGDTTHDDLVTLLWQAHPRKIRLETVPFPQVVPAGDEPAREALEDWPRPDDAGDVVGAFAEISRGLQFARGRLRAELTAEYEADWRQEARRLLGRVLELDDDARTRAEVAQPAMTWLTRSIQNAKWDDAREACELLRTLDPDGALTDAPLAEALNRLDAAEITARLDESQNDDAGRFFGLTVGIGPAAIELACSVMALALKSRTRAAACTMLCYLCSDSPGLLARYLEDSRWFVVRNVVFVLGQIGGPGVLPLLERAARHPDPRVLQAVVAALESGLRAPREAIRNACLEALNMKAA